MVTMLLVTFWADCGRWRNHITLHFVDVGYWCLCCPK